MKKYNNEDAVQEDAAFTGNWPQHAANLDRDDKEQDRDDEEEDDEDENTDWGNVDPAGGDEPTSPGSAV